MRNIKNKKFEHSRITQKRIRELFDYQEGGNLIWKIRAAKNVKANRIAGSMLNTGYRRVTIDGKDYKIHRLIYMWHYGALPEILDHIDNNRQNNRIENLRPCTHEQNSANTVHKVTSKSPHKNVYRLSNGKYRVSFKRKRCDYRQDFDYENFAVLAATLVRDLLDGEFANHGTYQ